MPPKLEVGAPTDNPVTILHENVFHLIRLSTDSNSKLDQLVQLVATQPPEPPLLPPQPPNQPRPPKMLLPNFDGSNRMIGCLRLTITSSIITFRLANSFHCQFSILREKPSASTNTLPPTNSLPPG